MVRTVSYYTADVKFFDNHTEEVMTFRGVKIPSKYTPEEAKKELVKELENSDFHVIDFEVADEEVKTETLKLKDILSINPILEF